MKHILFPSIQYDTQTKDLDTHLLGDESREYLKALFKQSKIKSNVDLSQTITRFGSLFTTVTIHQVQETNENLTSSSLYTVPKMIARWVCQRQRALPLLFPATIMNPNKLKPENIFLVFSKIG